MLFNSLEFLVFLPVVFATYWRLGHRAQNVLLLVASYVFYGWWDWRFLSLIVFSSVVDYAVGRRLGEEEDAGRRRRWLAVSLVTNLGLLSVFKYLGFFVDSAQALLTSLGLSVSLPTLQIVLPVGISFYTFQTLSYTIDVYRRRCAPHTDVVEFFAFVSFFPQLVAGPIERATHLLGQFSAPRVFSRRAATDGLRQMLWGLFKKIVIADTLAPSVDVAFGGGVSGLALALAVVFFAFQIYCDFSGYSDIAIGCARLFGFKLCRNFAYPYFSPNMSEFWKRWHISLSSWFGDYVYIPLGGNRSGRVQQFRNIVVTFGLSGLWHGANWTFVIWGLLHAVYYVPTVLARGLVPQSLGANKAWLLVRVAATFVAVCFAWIFFRANDVGHALHVIQGIFDGSWSLSAARWAGARPFALIGALVVTEWLARRHPHPLHLDRFPAPVRWSIYYVLVYVIAIWGNFGDAPFIYFQF